MTAAEFDALSWQEKVDELSRAASYASFKKYELLEKQGRQARKAKEPDLQLETEEGEGEE